MFNAGLLKKDVSHNIKRSLTENLLDRMFIYIMDSPHLKEIKLAGGEPMIMPEVEDFLKKLISVGRTNLRIFMLTNATVVKDQTIQLLEKFDEVELSCSIDGVGKWIEYQRAPANWKTIKRNYEKLVDTNIFVTLTPCWSHLNILSLVEYFKWLETTKVNYLAFNEVTYPSYLNWELVPMKYRKNLISQLDNIELSPYYSTNYKTFFERIKNDERQITDKERIELNNNVAIWDYKNKVKYINMYPWSKELLGENNET